MGSAHACAFLIHHVHIQAPFIPRPISSSTHQHKQQQQQQLLLALPPSTNSPAIALFASFVAIGALFKNIGLNIQESIFSTFLTYALPGSLIMAESLIVGASLLNIFLTPSLHFFFSPLATISTTSCS